MTSTVTLKQFADNYFATMKYLYSDSAGKPCDSLYIHNPKMEDRGNYYLLFDFTVSHDSYYDDTGVVNDTDYDERVTRPHHKVLIRMDEKVNVKIKMNKNKASNEYYNCDICNKNYCLYVQSRLKY